MCEIIRIAKVDSKSVKCLLDTSSRSLNKISVLREANRVNQAVYIECFKLQMLRYPLLKKILTQVVCKPT